MSFFQELKRRNVVRVGIAYVLLGWVVLQGADFLLDLAGAPDWVIRVFAVAGLVGFPFALFFAWAFELTPEGIKRESDVDRTLSVTPTTGKKLNGVIIGLLVAVIVLMGVERLYFAGVADSTEPMTEAEAKAPKTIAVLPFADMSQAQDQAWFADGLAEEILNALVRVPDLSVTARTSSFAYKGSSKPISEIAAELGVAHVLEGSVRSATNRIRVTAQLIRASDGFHLWSQNYDRDVADMIGIQEDLAKSIATALETSMDPEALAQMAQVGTESVEAYQEYLRGLQSFSDSFARSQSEQGLKQSYEHFERARTIDPGFAEAHVQAANYWKVELSPTRTDTGTSGFDAVRALREYNDRMGSAIENAKTEADRLRSLADRAMVDLRLREARRLFEQYLELRPNDDLARFELSGVLGMMSENEALRELLTYFEKKGETDIYAASVYVNEAYRVVDLPKAADFALKAVERWPNSDAILYQAHRTMVWSGRYREATEMALRYEALVPGSDPLVRARQACAAGDRETAQGILDGLDGTRGNGVSAEWLLHNMMGNRHEEVEVLRPIEQGGVPFQMASFLGYTKFDPSPYPSLMAVLEREGVRRPPPVEPPFKCPPPKQPSVAVLPFVNMSANAEQEYFSDGITEEIINELVRVPGLKVAARTSVFAFKGRDQDIRSIGGDLGVTHVLEGSVRSDGEQLRITAQLIQVDDGFHMWSETFDRERVNVFAIQDEIANAIAEVLTEQLIDFKSVAQEPVVGIREYDDYLRGRALLRSRTNEGLQQALVLFRGVTEASPEYAPAWAALAITADVMDDHPQAEKAARRALEIDPDNVDALNALAAAYRDTWRWAEAEALFDRAMAIDSDSTELLEDYAEFLLASGQMTLALEIAEKGYRADPYLDPLVGAYAEALMAAGRLDEALEVCRSAVARGGGGWLNSILVMALLELDEQEQLRETIAGWDLPERDRVHLLNALNNPGDEQAIAALLPVAEQEFGAQSYSLSADIAFMMLHHFGRVDEIIAATKRGIADGFGSSEYWFLPLTAVFRQHADFPALLEMANLPAYWDGTGWPEFCQRDEQARITCR
jgi:TolB-like protein